MNDMSKFPVSNVPEFSVVIATQATPEKMAQTQQCASLWVQGLSDLPLAPFIIPCVGKVSIANAYNEAVANCSTPYIILSHNDAFPPAALGRRVGQRLLSHMETHDLDLAGFCGSSRFTGPRWQDCNTDLYGAVLNIPPVPKPGDPFSAVVWRRPARVVTGIRVLDGYCLVARTSAIRDIGFDESYTGFHFYDMLTALKCSKAGKRVAVLCDVPILHQSSVGYSDPAWSADIERFLNECRGIADPGLVGLARTPGSISSPFPGMVLDALEKECEQLPAILEIK